MGDVPPSDAVRPHRRVPAESVLHGNGGNRLAWIDLPAGVRADIEARLGAAVVAARDQSGGFSPGLAARLRLADGQRVFVKAVNAGRNPESPGMYRREAAVMASLPAGVPAPRLRWSADDGDWVVLAFDEVDGVPPVLPWRAGELRRVLAALTGLSAALTPTPAAAATATSAAATGPSAAAGTGATAGIGTVVETLREDFTGWRTLAAAPDPRLAEVDPWAAANLAALAGWEARWEDAARGDTLLHCDLRADNVLLTPDGGVVFVDWPAACVGAPWIDLLLMLPSVGMQGGGDPAELAAAHPLTRAADPDALTAVLVALAGFFMAGSLRPPPPGLPTLRAFQRAQGVVALRWLRHRLEGDTGNTGAGPGNGGAGGAGDGVTGNGGTGGTSGSVGTA
jgi:aminoglycoside phosphotransferase (APT) family kinase protein